MLWFTVPGMWIGATSLPDGRTVNGRNAIMVREASPSVLQQRSLDSVPRLVHMVVMASFTHLRGASTPAFGQEQ